MKRLNKRIPCLILAVVLILTQVFLALPVEIFSQDTYNYEYLPQRQKYAIAPAALHKDESFYSQYVKTSETWAFNSIYYFTTHALNYNSEKTDYMASFFQTLELFDPILENLRLKGDLWVNFTVSLANTKPHWFTGERGIAIAGLTYLTGDYKGIQDDAEYRVYGHMDYKKFKGPDLELYYKWAGENGTRMKDSALVFADLESPKIKELYASADINGQNKQTSFTGITDDTSIYIHVKFDENIRFSDCNEAKHNILLKLKINKLGGMGINSPQYAQLVRLKDDTLTFLYNAPAKIDGEDLNHCIVGIDGIFESRTAENQTVYVNALDGGNDAYNLKVQTKTGNLWGHWINNQLTEYKSRSLITDLAGNPASPTLSCYKKTIYLDNTIPTVKQVKLEAPDNKSQYLGAGYKIQPVVVFSEPIYAYAGAEYIKYYIPELINVTLNIRDQWGNYVTVSGREFDEDNDTLYFNSVALPSDWMAEPITVSAPDPEDEKTKGRIWIKSITTDPQLPAYDARGNRLEDLSQTDIPLPEDEFYYDTEKPVIDTRMVQNEENDKYKPVLYDSDNDGK